MYGAEAVVLNLAKSLVAEGHVCIIGVFSHPHDPTPELFKAATANGLRACLIPCSAQVDFKVAGRIRILLSGEEIDVLHSHGYKADVYARFASRNPDVPVVSTCHTWHDTGLKDRIYGTIDRWVLRSFDAIIAVSSDVERRLLKAGVLPARIYRIRNGIDIGVFGREVASKDQANEPLIVGLACRLAHEKGIDLFAKTAAIILKQHQDVRFRVAGDGDQKTAFEDLLRELKISSSVKVLGRVEDMPKFFSSIDVLISSSRSEGFPMGLLEAMASRVPIVATSVGEVPQIVKNNETGILVPAGDVDALAAGTIALLTDADKRRAYGQRARAVALEELSASRMTSETTQVYQQVLHQARESVGKA
jgi:glycosyltransferase involved in cell wall biosynthesis